MVKPCQPESNFMAKPPFLMGKTGKTIIFNGDPLHQPSHHRATHHPFPQSLHSVSTLAAAASRAQAVVVWEASPVGGKSDEWDINSDIYWGFKI